jgi:hypothetical protein
MLPFVSLNAVTTTGAGTSRDMEDAVRPHTMVVVVTGLAGSEQNQVRLEGSLDGSTWLELGLASRNGNGNVIVTSEMLARHVRANFITLNGTATVTATIASGDGED